MAIINQGIDNYSPQALDRQYGKIGPGVKTIPYVSVAEANAAIYSGFRHIGKTVLIDDGAGPVEYWWKNGTTDPDLVVKGVSGSFAPYQITLTGDGTYEIPENYMIDKILVIPTVGFNLSVGMSLGASDLVPEIPMIQDQANVINLDVVALGGPVTIHFTGIPASTAFRMYLRTIIPSNV